ncbi:hypothetical protein PMAYCL1PPCAC_10457, partial [Pristionchus mayeri]
REALPTRMFKTEKLTGYIPRFSSSAMRLVPVILLIILGFLGTIEALTECVDLGDECAAKAHLCTIRMYDSITDYYCKKTCGRDCTPFTTTTTQRPCMDRAPDCADKVDICTRPEYASTAEKFCYKTCGLCT